MAVTTVDESWFTFSLKYDKSLVMLLFCLAVMSLLSASEMTYIVSGGALNSTHSDPGQTYWAQC